MKYRPFKLDGLMLKVQLSLLKGFSDIVFARDITAAILVSQTHPMGLKLCSYSNL